MKTDEKSISFNDINSYIALQIPEIRPTLEKLRFTIHKAIPEAEEVISYQMPAFKLNGIVIYFAAFKKHYSIFIRPKYMEHFQQELTAYKTSKSAVNIPLNQDVPEELVTKIVQYIAEDLKISVKTKKKK